MRYYKTLNPKFNVLFIFSLIFFSCQEEPSLIENHEIKSQEEIVRDGIAEEISISLAASLEKKEMRKFLKDEAIKQFDGDYDILFNKIKDEQITVSYENSKTQSLSFSELLFERSNTLRTSEDTKAMLDSIQKHFPLLQISIPALSSADAENWDIENEEPLVAVLESTYDESQTKEITAYDSEGNVHKLDPAIEPDRLVIVVGQSERILAINKSELEENNSGRISCDINAQSVYEDSQYSYYLRAEYLNAIDMCRVADPEPEPEPEPLCDRDKSFNKRDILVKAKIISDVGSFAEKFEKWPAGKPEFLIAILFGKNESGIKSFDNLSFRLDDEGWWERNWFLGERKAKTKNLNIPIVTFAKSTYGDRMKYQWIEEDPGTDAEWEYQVVTKFEGENTTTTGTTKVKVDGKRSENIGESIVEYCNRTSNGGTRYTVGNHIEFFISQE